MVGVSNKADADISIGAETLRTAQGWDLSVVAPDQVTAVSLDWVISISAPALCSFPVAAGTDHHTLSGFKPHTFLILGQSLQ